MVFLSLQTLKNLILLLFLSCQIAFGQVDSVADNATNINHLKANFAKADSARNSVLDSVNNIASVQWVKDSLTLGAWSSSLKSGIQNKFNSDSLTLKNKIDSLSVLRLPTAKYTAQLDSLSAKKQNMLDEVNNKQQALLSKTQHKISKWKLKVRSRLDSLGIKGAVPNTKLQNATIPNADLPNIPEVDIPNLDLPKMPELKVNDFSDMDLSPDLSAINKELPFNTPEGLSGIQENITGIKEEFSGLMDLKSNPDKTIVQVTDKLVGAKELDQLKDIKNPLEQISANNPDAVKQELQKQAMNHFEGKQQVLQAAMDEVSKYKKKYSSVQSLKDLPKKKPNEMKDKPFIERFVPGVTFQYQYNSGYLIDINMYGGYRLTGRVTTGLGWNQRATIQSSHRYWKRGAYIYGLRTFGEYELGKGFIIHIETELMNTMVMNPIQSTEAKTSREWVWGMMTGLKKTYKITRNLRGTAIIQYNLFDPKFKSPYNDRLNSRIGLEYYFKKKKKEEKRE